MIESKHGLLAQAEHAARRLPDALRTDHWYNDWQHAVAIILFDHLMAASRRRNARMTDRLMDKLTVYLFVHFLCEEEGMTFQANHGLLDLDTLHSHQKLHALFLDNWHCRIQGPYRRSELGFGELYDLVEDYYNKIVDHIDNTDQVCYGAKSAVDDHAIRRQVAHIAQSGLPLSPNMAGAGAIVSACCRSTYSLLGRDDLPLGARTPLGALNLARRPEASPADALRDRFWSRVNA